MSYIENIRIDNLTIEYIKNVDKGTISLNYNNPDTFGGSVIGVYGQNGSGKTALVSTLDFIKTLLSGESLQDDMYYYISSYSSYCYVKISFILKINSRPYNVNYEVKIKKDDNYKTRISYEKLEYSSKEYDNLIRINNTSLFEVNDEDKESDVTKCLYGPENKIKRLKSSIVQKLIVYQSLSKNENTSFIFNKNIFSLLKEVNNEIGYNIVYALHMYSKMNMFIINSNTGLNVLPLSIRLTNDDKIIKSDTFKLSLDKNKCDLKTFEITKKVIDQIDILIGALVPNLNIEIVKLEKELNESGNEIVSFELASSRNGIFTPLKYESEGIKKILCVLSSIIAMYNDPSIFVAIDELDSGIFEYLLGEFIEVINERGKGQLLFTSHNLRPLEVLDKSNIYITTTNGKNKYIKFTGIKEHHNLRSTLFRTIDLGGQKESIYDPTSKYEIAKALRKAGK